MVIPPMPSPNPPPQSQPATPGDIIKGRRLDTIDLQAICQGAFPGDLLNATAAAANTADFPEVPEGRIRVVQHVCGNTGAGVGGSAMVIQVIRLGVTYTLAANWLPSVDDSNITAKGIILKSGDILRVCDISSGGAVVYGSMMFVDVII